MSHELRTPLNAISGFSQLLYLKNSTLPHSKGIEYAKEIDQAATHLLGLIDQLLDMSQLQSRKLNLQKVALNLSVWFHELLPTLKQLSSDKEHTLICQLSEPLFSIDVDPQKLTQILYNLVSNAIKFTPSKGLITISISQTQQKTLFTVSDNGIGIEASHIDSIFEPFSQIESSYKKNYSGIGLGLPISRELVELHGGQLTYTPLKKWACFSLFIPHCPILKLG